MNDQAPDCVGICGAGQMGASSAVSFKRAGYRVLLWDTHAETLGAAEQKIQEKDRWVDEHVGPSSTVLTRSPASQTGSSTALPRSLTQRSSSSPSARARRTARRSS